jgi:fructose-specific component phosphotransferase system IIB-like protein
MKINYIRSVDMGQARNYISKLPIDHYNHKDRVEVTLADGTIMTYVLQKCWVNERDSKKFILPYFEDN